MRLKLYHLSSLLFALMLAACAHQTKIQPSTTHIDSSLENLQDSQTPPEKSHQEPPTEKIKTSSFSKTKEKEPTYSVVVNEVSVKEILFALARESKLNVDISPSISGLVTLNAVDQTLPAILERLARQVSMIYRVENQVLVIEPDHPIVRNYKVNYVNMDRDTKGGVSVTNQLASTTSASKSVAGGLNNSSTAISSTSNNHFWESLIKNIDEILQETDKQVLINRMDSDVRLQAEYDSATKNTPSVSSVVDTQKNKVESGSEVKNQPLSLSESADKSLKSYKTLFASKIIANKETGVLSVRATQKQHEKVREFIDLVESSAKRQVLIEATIVEVELKNNYQSGIDWGRLNRGNTGFVFGQSLGAKSVNFDKTTGAFTQGDASSLGSTSSAGFVAAYLNPTSALGNISASITLLEQFGNTKVLSSAISAASTGERPGNLRVPDSFSSNEQPVNYDGSSDSGCLNFNATNGLPLINGSVNMRCLGRFPWKDLGMHIAPSESDPNGLMPWYAVSSNLVDPTCFSVLNSSALNLTYTPNAPLDCTGTGLPYPWLTVRDGNGNVISNRVAAIIFIPNEPMGAQSRTSPPNLGMANQYLDTLVVPSNCVQPCIAGTYSNADMDNDFITSPSTSDYAKKSSFNDKLLYITIDELMVLVEKRVAQEVVKKLRDYFQVSSTNFDGRFYPYASSLDDPNNTCTEDVMTGLIPVAPAFAECTSDSSCKVGFPEIKKVEFTLKSGGVYTSKTGACNKLAGSCECIGVGTCRKTTIPKSTFSCSSDGVCKSAEDVGAPIGSAVGEFKFTYLSKQPDVTAPKGYCNGASGTVKCDGVGSFYSPGNKCSHPNKGLSLPSWFTDNRWQDLIYYAISDDCSFKNPGCLQGGLSVGIKKNIHSVVVSSGSKLSNQNRPSNSLYDYLDALNPPPNYGITLFDSIGTKKSTIYNDQMFIVSPK